ncbi:MAG: PAS domain S-box protein [Deltaproteobacteria bacterium]|nr:PAS domain S-box protein [Deltaproteobacteria bacterium]
MADKTIKRGIRKRFVISILVVGVVPLMIGLYLTYQDGTTTRRNSIGASFQEMAKETANKIDMIIKREIVDAQRFAISPDIGNAIKHREYEKGGLNDYVRHFIGYGDVNEIYSLIIVNAKGDYIAGVKEALKKNYSNERWFHDALNNGKGNVYAGDLKLDEASGMYLMSIAAPVMDNEKAIGVVVIKYRVDKLLEIINNVRIESTGHANLVDSSGTIIMCPIFPPRSHHINFALLNIMLQGKSGWSVVEDDAHGGKNSIIGFAPVESTLDPENRWFAGNRWYIFIRQSPSEVYAPIYLLIFKIFVFGGILITLISLAGVYAARKFVKPINELYIGVEHIGQGNLDYRLDIKTNDEIEMLADEFNKMAGKLQESYSILENRNKELQASEERYKDLIENSPEMIHSVNTDRYFVSVNKTELNILGFGLEEMRNKKIEDIVPEEFKDKTVHHIERAMKDGLSTVETQFITKNGRRIDVEITATALYHPITGNFIKTRAFVRDITDRKKLERQLKEYYEILEQKVYDRTRELKETKDYLENLFETANDVIYTLNTDGIITYVNKKIEEWGYKKDELIGKSFFMIFSSEHRGERFKKTIREGIKQTYSAEVVSKSGETRYAILSISPIRGSKGKITEVLGIAKDITEQKRFEQQIAHTEKMSAIGQLAAGIAHEINNPLGGILNCLYNLRKKKFSPEREEEYYRAMEDGIHRVKKIVSQLLDFSGQHEPEFIPVDINSLIAEVLFLLNYAFSKNGIRIEKAFDTSIPMLMLDKHKMQQVFTNILLNAVQAIEGKGQIILKTRQKNGWCYVDITDTGKGIPPNILPKIFDPFVTTKDVGKGTGLGLSVSKGIVEMHDGKIDVKSEISKGSTFTIKLPMYSAALHDDIEAYNI